MLSFKLITCYLNLIIINLAKTTKVEAQIANYIKMQNINNKIFFSKIYNSVLLSVNIYLPFLKNYFFLKIFNNVVTRSII